MAVSMRNGRMFVVLVFVLVCVAGLTFSVAARSSQEAARHYRLQDGDYVAIPALRWTCVMSADRGRPLFTCTSDDKPVRSVTVFPHQIYVGVTRAPVRVHGGYRFTY